MSYSKITATQKLPRLIGVTPTKFIQHIASVWWNLLYSFFIHARSTCSHTFPSTLTWSINVIHETLHCKRSHPSCMSCKLRIFINVYKKFSLCFCQTGRKKKPFERRHCVEWSLIKFRFNQVFKTKIYIFWPLKMWHLKLFSRCSSQTLTMLLMYFFFGLLWLADSQRIENLKRSKPPTSKTNK